MYDARDILLNLVNLSQTILLWNNSKNRGGKLRLNHLLIFFVLVLSDSLVGQLNFDYINFSILME